MLEYDWINAFEVTDVNNTRHLLDCIICNHCYFLEINIRFQREICNGCHNLTQRAMVFNDVSIISVEGNEEQVFSGGRKVHRPDKYIYSITIKFF